jgi:hypothetical protein
MTTLRDRPVWKLEAPFQCRPCKKHRGAPPVEIIKLIKMHEIVPHKSEYAQEDETPRCLMMSSAHSRSSNILDEKRRAPWKCPDCSKHSDAGTVGAPRRQSPILALFPGSNDQYKIREAIYRAREEHDPFLPALRQRHALDWRRLSDSFSNLGGRSEEYRRFVGCGKSGSALPNRTPEGSQKRARSSGPPPPIHLR